MYDAAPLECATIPLQLWFCEGQAEIAVGKFHDPFATLTLFHDRMTMPSIIRASLFLHKNALALSGYLFDLYQFFPSGAYLIRHGVISELTFANGENIDGLEYVLYKKPDIFC